MLTGKFVCHLRRVNDYCTAGFLVTSTPRPWRLAVAFCAPEASLRESWYLATTIGERIYTYEWTQDRYPSSLRRLWWSDEYRPSKYPPGSRGRSSHPPLSDLNGTAIGELDQPHTLHRMKGSDITQRILRCKTLQCFRSDGN